MFEKSRKVSVIVAPHGSSKSWNRDVSLPVLVGAGVVLAVLPIVLILSLIQLADHSARVREVESLRAENANLVQQGRRIRELESELAGMQEFETRIRRWAGIEMSGPLTPEGLEKSRHRWEREERLLSEIPSLAPVPGWMSRGYQPGKNEHHGMDFVGETGDPVHAAALGVVEFAGWDDTFGNLVVLDHGNGYMSHYGHNDSLLVTEGNLVPRGQTIARLGNTGESTAPHVHFEIRLDGESLDPAFLLSPAG